jgi:hypothetical protein
MQTYEQPERGWLYGDRASAVQFDRLASLAWQAFLGTPDGKAQYASSPENDTDRWLTVVYRQLEFNLTAGPNYHRRQDCLVFRNADGAEQITDAAEYALPKTYGPIRDPEDRPSLNHPFERWRIKELTTDVFNASAAALDVLLANPNPEGDHVISSQEMDVYQRSQSFQQANHQIESIILAQGRHFPVYRLEGKPSSRALPSSCPKADPKPPVELRPDGELMAELEATYRSQHIIDGEQSLHWVGRQKTADTTCTCDLTALLHVAHSAELQNLRHLRQDVVALVRLLRSWAVGRHQSQQFRKAGVMMSEQPGPDFQPLDRLQRRISESASLASVALPDGVPRIPDWVSDPEGLPQSEEWAEWESDWRAVRVAVEFRLAALDCCPLPCQSQTILQVDTREVPLEAPANTPTPLREAFEAAAAGDRNAATLLMPLVYDELRKIAAARLTLEPVPGRTFS